MKKLYIDFDGVILDTISPLYETARNLNYDINDEEFYRTFDFKKVLKDEYILNDSINCIKKLINSKKFDVSILTHCSSINEGADKISYIRKFFKDMTVIICPKCISKTKMLPMRNAILVDDYSKNLNEWESEGGIAVKFSKESKETRFTVINKLDKLIEIF